MRAGQRVERSPFSPLPCISCPKSGKHNEPNPSAELRGRNRALWELYWQVKAGAAMPDDALVRENLALIEKIRARINEQRQDVRALLSFFARE